MTSDHIKERKKNDEHYRAGVANGISYAVHRFLENIHINNIDQLIEKTIDSLIKEFHE